MKTLTELQNKIIERIDKRLDNLSVNDPKLNVYTRDKVLGAVYSEIVSTFRDERLLIEAERKRLECDRINRNAYEPFPLAMFIPTLL